CFNFLVLYQYHDVRRGRAIRRVHKFAGLNCNYLRVSDGDRKHQQHECADNRVECSESHLIVLKIVEVSDPSAIARWYCFLDCDWRDEDVRSNDSLMKLLDCAAHFYQAWFHYFCIDTAQVKFFTKLRVHKLHRFH